MWIDVKSKEARDALVQDYLARRKRLQTRFESERVGEADLQFDATKLFQPIVASQQAAVTEQASKQATEIEKVTKALEQLPAAIAAEANFNPVAALFGEDTTASKSPAQALLVRPDPTLFVNADQDLNLEVIKKFGFNPPSELELTNTEAIDRLIEGINKVNTYKLGQAKKKANTAEDREAIERDQDALRDYRSRLCLLTEGYKLTQRKGSGLKLKGGRFGNLTIDPVSLQAGRLRAFESGNLVLEAPADLTLYDLLTKRFVKTKQYTPQAVETFKKLVEMAGLPVHGCKSKKHQLMRGGAVQFYNDPNQLVERLKLLIASKQAGNTGVDDEISAILDELMRTGAISNDLVDQLNRSLLVA